LADDLSKLRENTMKMHLLPAVGGLAIGPMLQPAYRDFLTFHDFRIVPAPLWCETPERLSEAS
ncbi:MAG TPA: hypothetical protein VN957_30300, partial [Chthoniobacterales bacterium]|nr:hypothetical protein [Chthoniobacterales bacterium]